MANYHLTVKAISRNFGRSCVSSLAYRSASMLVDQRTGETYDYRNKENVEYVEICISNNAPLWIKQLSDECKINREQTLQKLSDVFEITEKRKDSQVYREIEFSLPRELTNEQNISWARAFIHDTCVAKGMIAIMNYHFDIDEKTGEEKPQHTLIQSPQHSFLWDIQEIAFGIYIARFQDTFHELSCEFALEVKESFVPSKDETEENFIQPVLVGNFPSIDIQRFQQKILWDEYLQGMILIQFQLKILEQLLLFCEDKQTPYLLLTFNEANQDYLEIYQCFIISDEEVLSTDGDQTEITIPSDVSVYDDLIDLIQDVDHKFRKTLWKEQRVNPTYRHYLKSGALL